MTSSECGVREVLSFLPDRLAREIVRISEGRVGGLAEIREIRVRCVMRSSFLHKGDSIPLFNTVTEDEVAEVLNKICGGALYAHHNTISQGYVSLPSGVRVGVGGVARYEYKSFVGIGRVRSLVFRIPGHECSFSNELKDAFSGVRAGMLIYSPPGVGKTTALRSLARSLSSGPYGKRVCVIDERYEFCDEDYAGCEIDILKGYKRRLGLEIATRTMSAEIIMLDEIGADDAESIKDAVKCGVPIIATAHAASAEELRAKVSLAPLFALGVFDVLVGIKKDGEKYRLEIDRYE